MEIKRLDRIVIAVIAVVLIIWAFSRGCRGGKGGAADTRDSLGTHQTAQTTNKNEVVNAKIKIFVSMDSLRVRTGPNKDSSVVAILRKGESITFSGEKSPFTNKIKLDGVLYDEPWLKVTTGSGKLGWVFGAGVRFYRK